MGLSCTKLIQGSVPVTSSRSWPHDLTKPSGEQLPHSPGRMSLKSQMNSGASETTWAGRVTAKRAPAPAASVADHPRARGRKPLRTAFGLLDEPRRLGRATAATRAVRCLVLADGFGRVGAALVGGVGLALVRRHAEEIRRRQDHARGFELASRTVLRRVAFRHRPHVRKRTAIVAEIFVYRHLFLPRDPIHTIVFDAFSSRGPVPTSLENAIIRHGGCGAADT